MRFQKFPVVVAAMLAAMFIADVAVADDGEDKTSRDSALKQVTYDIKYLASDELGGRQPGTPGMDLAEKHIIDEFKKAGVKPGMPDGTFKQAFDVGGRSKAKLDEKTAAMSFAGPDDTKIELKLGEHFLPQESRKAINLDSEMVFVGYGINAQEHNYNDYREMDVKGKVVVLIRREPQQENADSVFDGKEVSRYSYIQAKVQAAVEAGAAAIIMVNDGLSAPDDERDELAPSSQFGRTTQVIPFIQIKRSVLDKVLKKTPLVHGPGEKLSSLADVEKLIDEKLEPISQTMPGWKVTAKAEFVREPVMAYNIIGVVEGEGPHAEETIVIGAHHDHLGKGAYGSRAQGRRGEVHNGADDNATGTAAVLELARRFNKRDKKPGRRLVFVCFSAEEMGLLGANHYVANPIVPLEKTVAMINFDMIGWLRDAKLTIYNWNTSPDFAPVIDKANESFKLNLIKPGRAFAGSDHLPFNSRKVPNVFIHTGLTDTYHTPDDDFETIDCNGALTVIEYSEAFIDGLCKMDKAPGYGPPKSVRLGAMMAGQDDGGVMVEGVTDGSVAQRMGLQKGDIILSVGGEEVKTRRDVNRIVRREVGKTVGFKIKRSDAEMTLNVELKGD